MTKRKKRSKFGITFEWFQGDVSTGKIAMDGPGWDSLYRLVARLTPGTCDRLSGGIEVARTTLDSLVNGAGGTRTRAFLSVSELNAFLESDEPL